MARGGKRSCRSRRRPEWSVADCVYALDDRGERVGVGVRTPRKNNSTKSDSRYLIVTWGFGVRRTTRFTRTSRLVPSNNARATL
jgi:hypothetical protein